MCLMRKKSGSSTYAWSVTDSAIQYNTIQYNTIQYTIRLIYDDKMHQ